MIRDFPQGFGKISGGNREYFIGPPISRVPEKETRL